MRSFLKVLSLNLLVLGFLLGVVELLFGGWVIGPDFRDLNIPRNQNRVIDASNLYAGGERVLYTRDAWGLRGDYPDPGAIDILVLGGSTTDERFISDGQTWVDLIGSKFAEDGRPQVVVNAGIAGHSSYGHVEALRRWLPHIPGLKARYVLVYVGINDVLLKEPKINDTFELRDYQLSWRYFVSSRSALLRLYRAIKSQFVAPQRAVLHGAREELKATEWFEIGAPHDLSSMRESIIELLVAYHQRLKLLAGHIRDFGAEPIFVTQARGDYRIRNGRLYGYKNAAGKVVAGGYRGITLFNTETLRTCREIEISCIDLGSKIAFVNGDLFDAMHTTPQGSRKVADTLFPLLAPLIKDRPENLPRPDG